MHPLRGHASRASEAHFGSQASPTAEATGQVGPLAQRNEKLKQKLKGVEGGKDTDDSDTEDDAGHEQEDELTLDVLRGMLKLVKASGKSDTCPHVLELQAKITAKEQAA